MPQQGKLDHASRPPKFAPAPAPIRLPHADAEGGSDGDAARIGAELRAARTRHGWSVASAAAALRIREQYLHAIEAGHPAGLPGAAYAVGFVRNYAALLGLDADALVRRFRACLLDAPEPALFFPPLARAGLPRGAAIVLGLFLACGAYAGWYRVAADADSRAAERVEKVPERLAALTAPPSGQARERAAPPAAPSAEAVAAEEPTEDGAAEPAPAPMPAADANPPAGRVAIRAHADCWIQVRDGAAILVARTLHAGESWSPEPGRPLAGLLLTAGNAGGIDLLLDGQPAPPLGGAGMVRRDVRLDPDSIRSMAQTASITGSTPLAGPR